MSNPNVSHRSAANGELRSKKEVDQPDKPNYALRRLGAAAALTATVAGAAWLSNKSVDAIQPFFDNTFSVTGENTVTITTGDTLWDLAEEHVEGIDSGEIDIRDVISYVKADPDNADVFEDRLLKPGESVDLPAEVKPVN